MRKIADIFSIIVVGSILLSACNMSVAAPATAEPVASAVPIDSSPSEIAATQPPVIIPIDLAGPPMEVGSRYTYIDGTVLVAVPGGKFIMGYGNADNPVHEVTLSDFWIYSTEVDNLQYQKCVKAGECAAPEPANNILYRNPFFVNFPVTGVTHAQATDYCRFVHGRLPTEAEWEKTARGTGGNIFPWGNNAPECSLLNFNYCKGKTTDVTNYKEGVSFYGALNMAGNVREWVADWYNPDYYDYSPAEDPLGPDLGEKRSVRSNSFQDSPDSAISASRFSLRPDMTLPDLGFRCVVEDPTYFAPYCQTIPLYGADVNGSSTDDLIPLPPECDQPSVGGKIDCKTQATYITVTDPLPAGASLNIQGNCTGGPPTYKCTGGGSVTVIPQQCSVPVPPSGGSCAPGYEYDSATNTCVGRGLGTQCLAGFNYDPALQCCTAQDSAASVYETCPPGFYKQGNACVPGNNPPPLLVVSKNFSPVAVCDGQVHDEPCDPLKDPNKCQPVACDPQKDPDCQTPPPVCDPQKDPDCQTPPPVCDPQTDPNCQPPADDDVDQGDDDDVCTGQWVCYGEYPNNICYCDTLR